MTYDIIICGGGAAGLSFLHHVLQSAWSTKQILLLERDDKEVNDKTWCYWDTKAPTYEAARLQSWKQIEITDDQFSYSEELKNYRYYHIRSQNFYKEVNDLARTFPNVSKIKADVVGITNTDEGATVTTADRQYKAKQVINSIPHLFDPHIKRPFTQNFLGWHVKTKQALFDPNRASLMDFRSVPAKLPAFFYVLPFSGTEALVEFTQFSKIVGTRSFFTRYLDTYMQQVLGCTDYELVEEEFGVIPMHNYQFRPQPASHIYQIGTAGGDTKPSTGYTFQFIQKHCEALLRQLIMGKTMKSRSVRFAFYDELLLQIMLQKPQMVRPIMKSLFLNNGFERVFQFLDEETSLARELRLFMNLPWSPFLQALFAKKQSLYEPAGQSACDHLQPAAVNSAK